MTNQPITVKEAIKAAKPETFTELRDAYYKAAEGLAALRAAIDSLAEDTVDPDSRDSDLLDRRLDRLDGQVKAAEKQISDTQLGVWL